MNEGESPAPRPRLDRVVHERARLIILAYLSSSLRPSVGFTELRDRLELTAGNLSIQLKTLEGAGYVKIVKSFVDNRPNTSVSLTAKGAQALAGYLEEMEHLVRRLKPGAGQRRD